MTGEDRYVAALEEAGLADVRPLYRDLLKRLRDENPDAYREGVRRYEEELAPAMEEGDEPLRRWIEYGAWLAARVAPGRVTAVDGSGRASELEGLAPQVEEEAGAGEAGARQLGLEAAAGAGPPEAGAGEEEKDRIPPGALILHLPDRDREPGIPLAIPADPTEFQEAALNLLCP